MFVNPHTRAKATKLRQAFKEALVIERSAKAFARETGFSGMLPGRLKASRRRTAKFSEAFRVQPFKLQTAPATAFCCAGAARLSGWMAFAQPAQKSTK